MSNQSYLTEIATLHEESLAKHDNVQASTLPTILLTYDGVNNVTRDSEKMNLIVRRPTTSAKHHHGRTKYLGYDVAHDDMLKYGLYPAMHKRFDRLYQNLLSDEDIEAGMIFYLEPNKKISSTTTSPTTSGDEELLLLVECGATPSMNNKRRKNVSEPSNCDYFNYYRSLRCKDMIARSKK